MNSGSGSLTRRIDVDQYFQLDAVLDGTQDFRWRPGEMAGTLECWTAT